MPIIAENRFLWYVDDDGEVIGKASQEFAIVRKRCDLINEDTEVFLRIWRDDRYRDHKIDRTKLNLKCLPSFLLKKNVTLPTNPDWLAELCDHAMATDSEAPIEYYHKNLGFEEVDGSLVYLAGKPIGNLSEEEKTSTYYDKKALSSRGSFDSWRQVMQEEVIGNIPLELALSIGASAPLVHLLREDGVFAELPVIALIGDSSTGKTLAMRAMGALDGSPAEGIGRLKDLNATIAAFFKMMGTQKGTIFLFDEMTGKGDWNISDVLYQAVKGIERARCKPNGELSDRATFSGTIVLSGEKSLLENEKLNVGMLARIVELSLPWSNSKEHAERLCRKLHENHGCAIYPLVESILSKYEANKTVFVDMFDEEVNTLMKIAPTEYNTDGRVYNIYATLLVAAKVASEAWQLPLNVEAIREILLENHKKKKPLATQAKRLYDLVMAKVNQNTSCFPDRVIRGGMADIVSSRVLGRRDKRGEQVTVWITKKAFQEFVKDEFPNPTPLFAELAKQELMVTDAYRHYAFERRLVIGTCMCHGFKISIMADDQSIIKTLPKPKKKKPININLLLDDEDEKEIIEETVKEIEETASSSECNTALCEAC